MSKRKYRFVGDDVRLIDLKSEPLILLRRHQGTSGYGQPEFVQETVVNFCRKAGFEPNVICEANEISTLLALVDAGVGIGIVPQSGCNLYKNSNIQFKHILQPELQSRSSAIIWFKGRYLCTAAKRFITF